MWIDFQSKKLRKDSDLRLLTSPYTLVLSIAFSFLCVLIGPLPQGWTQNPSSTSTSSPNTPLRSSNPLLTTTSSFPSTPFFNGARFAIDMSTVSRTKPNGSLVQFEEFVGLDFYSELQTDSRHWGSFVFQFYTFRFDMVVHPNEMMDGQGRWAYAPCVIAPNLILIPQGKLNLKIGHIWPNYGLRDQINTTGTLRRLIDLENVGLPVDWGLEFQGEHTGITYSVALLRGTGNGWTNEGNPYMVTGRLGTAEGALPFEIGLSGLQGRLKLGTKLVPRWRAGVDFQYFGPVNLLFEGSIGQDYGVDDVFNMITEINWKSAFETVTLYTQYRQLYTVARKTSPVTLGVLYTPIPNLYLGLEGGYALNEDAPQFNTQIRYRW